MLPIGSKKRAWGHIIVTDGRAGVYNTHEYARFDTIQLIHYEPTDGLIDSMMDRHTDTDSYRVVSLPLKRRAAVCGEINVN